MPCLRCSKDYIFRLTLYLSLTFSRKSGFSFRKWTTIVLRCFILSYFLGHFAGGLWHGTFGYSSLHMFIAVHCYHPVLRSDFEMALIKEDISCSKKCAKFDAASMMLIGSSSWYTWTLFLLIVQLWVPIEVLLSLVSYWSSFTGVFRLKTQKYLSLVRVLRGIHKSKRVSFIACDPYYRRFNFKLWSVANAQQLLLVCIF